jgi:hypothetical protein
VEIRQGAQSVPTRPIVLFMAVLSVLALALTGWYVLTSSAPHRIVGGPTISTTVGPDAADRNLQLLQARGELQSKAEATHGH